MQWMRGEVRPKGVASLPPHQPRSACASLSSFPSRGSLCPPLVPRSLPPRGKGDRVRWMRGDGCRELGGIHATSSASLGLRLTQQLPLKGKPCPPLVPRSLPPRGKGDRLWWMRGDGCRFHLISLTSFDSFCCRRRSPLKYRLSDISHPRLAGELPRGEAYARQKSPNLPRMNDAFPRH